MNSNETLFYPFIVSVNKCGRCCNIIDDPCARVCVPDNVKNMNVKIFNVMSGVNKTRFLVQHKSCKSKCALNKSVRNSNQKWNYDECQCKCKELYDWGSCKYDYIW